MPLQNRVTPFGELVAVSARGLMMGARGVLHDDRQRIVRPWRLKRWITCLTEFRGRRRQIMRPHTYTELFFLDEATAFAAGHRPCAECRHASYLRFKAAWSAWSGTPAPRIYAGDMDARLHTDRLEGRGPVQRQRVYEETLGALPDGVFIAREGQPWLLWRGRLLAWTPAGYTTHQPARPADRVTVLTPRALVATFRAGYIPMVHPSAGQDA